MEGIKNVSHKKKIHCSFTVESILPCVVCLTLTRHRHSVKDIKPSWYSGSSTPVCESCCQDEAVKPVPPSVRSRYMVRRMQCRKCGHVATEAKFKRFQTSDWLHCPNCGIKKNKKAKDRVKSFIKVYLVQREFRLDSHGYIIVDTVKP